jgi:hypothetical protein
MARPPSYAIELPGLGPQFNRLVVGGRGVLHGAALIAPKAWVDYKSSAGNGSPKGYPRMIPGPQKEDWECSV